MLRLLMKFLQLKMDLQLMIVKKIVSPAPIKKQPLPNDKKKEDK